jgi:hypothetical protein
VNEKVFDFSFFACSYNFFWAASAKTKVGSGYCSRPDAMGFYL